MSIESSDPNRSTDPGDLSRVAPRPTSPGITAASATMAVARSGANPAEVARTGASGCAPSPQGGDGEARITVEARRRIGRNLRLHSAEELNQPLPDRFDALLADLAARSTTGGSS